MNEFDQKHNFRDVIGGRACANRFRCFSIYRGNTCGEMCRLPSPRRRRLRLRRRCFFFLFCFFSPFFPRAFLFFLLAACVLRCEKTTSLRGTRHYRDDAGPIVRCEFRVRLFARTTAAADIYPSTPTC